MPIHTRFNSDIRDALRIIRESEMKPIKPDAPSPDAIPYTSQDTLMTNVLAAAKQEFGADFNTIKNPMLYYPSDGDITLSGIIPEMNDAKFQFRYKVGDGAGCYVWSNPYMPISDKTIQTLSKVNGVCKNWRDEISKSEDSRPSNYRDPNDMQHNRQGQTGEIENVGEEDKSGNSDNSGGDASQGGGQDQVQGPEGKGQMSESRIRRGDDIVGTRRRQRWKSSENL